MKRLITLIICNVMGVITIITLGIIGDVLFWTAAHNAHPDKPGHGVPFISVIGFLVAFLYETIMMIFIGFAIRRYVRMKREERKILENC